MTEFLEQKKKEFEKCQELYRLRVLEHLSYREISQQMGMPCSSVYKKIRTFESENPELSSRMQKQGKEITPDDYKALVQEVTELKKQVKAERLRADFYEEMVAFGKEVYGIDLKKAGTK